MTIDITPEAVEHLCAIHEGYGQHGTVATLRALSAALTASQAETAAAYEAAAELASNIAPLLSVPVQQAIRALTPADSKAALDRMLAEARADGMREAVKILEATYAARRNAGLESGFNAMMAAKEAILAAIPKGKDHE